MVDCRDPGDHGLRGSVRVMQAVGPPSHLYDTGEVPRNMPQIDARVRADAERASTERVEHLSQLIRSAACLWS